MLNANGLSQQEDISIGLVMSGNPPIVVKTADVMIADYEVTDYVFSVGKYSVARSGGPQGCSLELRSISTGTGADVLSLLCRVRTAGQSDFADLGTVRLLIQYPQGQLQSQGMDDPAILERPELYAKQSEGGWAVVHDFQIYNTGLNAPRASASSRMIVDFILN
ncbi:MAG: hypothetical protein AAFY25_11115 [Pseudomonadota bacterium]